MGCCSESPQRGVYVKESIVHRRPLGQTPLDPETKNRILADVRQDQTSREVSYRGQALKLFPHVCARCGREFAGKRLRELTVHHKDNDHTNNPPDGGNWELLCLYCHDDAHEAYERTGGRTSSLGSGESSLGFRPFAGLERFIKPQEEETESGQ